MRHYVACTGDLSSLRFAHCQLAQAARPELLGKVRNGKHAAIATDGRYRKRASFHKLACDELHDVPAKTWVPARAAIVYFWTPAILPGLDSLGPLTRDVIS